VSEVISSVGNLQHYIQVMDQLHNLINLLLVHVGYGIRVDKNVVWMWRGKQKSLPPLDIHLVSRPEFSSCTDWAIWCTTSCMFRVLTFSDVLIYSVALE